MKKKRYLPFGYQMEKGEIIPHPDEGPLVQAIFSKYLERTALSTLAKYASLSGIPYRNEKNPPADLLRKLWANPQASQYADRIHLVGMPKMRDKHRLHTRRTIAAKRDCPIKPGN